MRNVQTTRSLDEDLYYYKLQKAKKHAARAKPAMRMQCASCDKFKLCHDKAGAWLCDECNK